MMVCVNLHDKTLVSHLYKLFDSQVFRRFDDYSNDYSSCNESKSKHPHTSTWIPFDNVTLNSRTMFPFSVCVRRELDLVIAQIVLDFTFITLFTLTHHQFVCIVYIVCYLQSVVYRWLLRHTHTPPITFTNNVLYNYYDISFQR